MYVCVCNAVTDTDIRQAVDEGVRNLKQLRQATGCANTCGSCSEAAIEVIQQALSTQRSSQNLLQVLQLA